MVLKDELAKYKKIIENEIEKTIKIEEVPQKKILESMKYSLLAGGKRLRPILVLKSCELFKGEMEKAMPFAIAMEMIHTYSLIHDDLPAMDNDDYRRGKLTNHKVFGEGIAILAGDSLLNMAHEVMIESVVRNQNNSNFAKAMREISNSSGIDGMIGGQVVDILSESGKVDKKTLDFIHKNKTSALIEASLVSGALIAGATKEEIESLRKYGNCIGISFQIRDDILDVIGEQSKVGKNIGSDVEKHKLTYISLHGLEKAKKDVNKLCDKAINIIKELEVENKKFFIDLASYLKDRDY